MFKRCYSCFRPKQHCLCPEVTVIDPGVSFLFLMHPKEAYQQKTGTGRLCALSLVESEILVGIDFTTNVRLLELTSGREGSTPYGDGTKYYPVVLFPSQQAFTAADPRLRNASAGKKLLIIVIDATWFFAKKMWKLSRSLHDLPCLSFENDYRSRFIFKKQPAPEYLSTMESVGYLIRELKAAGLAEPRADESALFRLFDTMVRFQLSCEQTRNEEQARDLHPELFKRQ
ncbi:MAG TPA: tRNA-uridine aminocarboxypropyltransferase [Treponemataceae bacterium]|nr:tRNA-uridine aminocarboxypropyltransferase [Treponemataceae bacterium]HOS34316.1 tRNA-uridine aminocarboxypropyltransferase [Treponemataceae bacterium]HPL90588.1 tRNA-uridine aminocarboxypropyltransferase [Treponemataceae bacterium]HRR02182.1 tRNA-uridine aminocarboxypropyltransferase [Treponemataceae bacterium]